jgi:hypothetical protein
MSIHSPHEPLEGWRVSKRSGQSERLILPPPPWVTALIVVMLLAALAALPGPNLRAIFVPTAMEAPAPDPTLAPAAPTPAPCLSGEAQRGRNASLAAEGHWEQVVDETGGALRQDGLCAGDRLALRSDLLAARMELVLASPAAPFDQRGQQDQLRRYVAIRDEASDLGLIFPPALGLAQRAYAAGDFLLAVGLFEEAWARGVFQAGDQEQIRGYASALYNLGYWWTHAPGPAYQAGLVMLATSDAVDQRFHVGSGAAEELLTSLLGPDRSAWPSPAPSPLLAVGQ